MSIKHSKLSRGVRKAIRTSYLSLIEHQRAYLSSQKTLLSKLKLTKEQLIVAKRLEKNSLRIMDAYTCLEAGAPISTAIAMSIIRTTRSQIPGFIERNKQKFYPGQLDMLKELYKNFGKDIQRIRKEALRLPTILSPAFLVDARNINFEALRNTVGEKNFKRYQKHMAKVMEILANRARRLEAQKNAAPSN